MNSLVFNNGILIVLLSIICLLSWWLVGSFIRYLNNHDIVDRPNDRRLHHGSVPRGGGLVIVAVMLVVLISQAFLSFRYAVFGGLGIAMLLWAGLSWWDDTRNLSAKFRLGIQMLFALLLIFAFGAVNSIQLGAERLIILYGFGIPLTFIGIIWFANLYNFMDGLDGLAASQTIVGAITLAFWFWQAGDSHIAFTCLALAASSYGFLIWNWQPAKIFMGDVGSVTIGAFFAVLLIFANTRYQLPVISFVLLFGVFVFDASLTILRRAFNGEKIWLPHRTHYYQRLATIGIGHNKILAIQVVLMLVCSIIASVSLIDRDRIGAAVLIESLILTACAIFVVILEKKNARVSRKTSNG